MNYIQALKSEFFEVILILLGFSITMSIPLVIYENRVAISEFILQIEFLTALVVGVLALLASLLFSFALVCLFSLVRLFATSRKSTR